MRNRLFVLCSLVILPMIGWGQAIKDLTPLPRVLSYEAALPAAVQRELDKITAERIQKTVQQEDLSPVLYDKASQRKYRWVLPIYTITNSSAGHEPLASGTGKFNAKKDRLSSAIIDANQRIQILNKKRQICDPSLFEFTMPEAGLHIAGNRIVMDGFLPDFVAGLYPTTQEITVTHKQSGLTYRYQIKLTFHDEVAWHGLNKELVFMSYPNAVYPDIAILYNYTDQQVMFVQFPFTIYGNGIDGANGRRGYNGANGINQYSWTDKDGKTHTTRGTCGSAGGNGEDGQDGTDGGQFLIIMDSTLVATSGTESVTAWIQAGKGGNGGKGGQGGLHGRGSGCYGQAANGSDGRHGHNGKRGDFLYVITNTSNLRNIFIP